MNVEELLENLKAAASPDDAVAMKAYMKNKFEFLGIKTPARRKLAKIFFKQQTDSVIDWVFINGAWNNPYRELQYAALDYLEICKKLLTPTDLPHLKKLAQTKSWWDTIDFLDRLVGSIIARFPETKEIILSWSCDKDFWLRRLAIDHQLLRKEETDTELLEKILVNNLGQTEFFINKAIGWALRDYSKTNPDWVRDFIERHQAEMAALSIREGSKYL
ncbi:DNA alkylation repair enzyme [Streptococcus cristatus]|uniref:DNA alkylation repair enzyme n=1 Tax=Streptococcus cristatus TaxID=45634 RepID=A0A3R9M1P5_STRCR|nr:DNA alkylation repair protein [Streptococcus cristatus]RSJ77288.1 DNA alkylation repair enzyme [Streptococcus cristatus]RSJ79390.1 DNA alkylation repair enzyme [Streptococcus cristatus]RSJ85184.1 DNA alkylation repair enzyme [Streptococcus cristatus]RSJ85282.1 DNA alkylation repair enzyme [Streptococcus cristatus]